MWIGDNLSSREGSVVSTRGRSSGKFGIINNDEENIRRFTRGLRDDFKIENIKLDIHIPQGVGLEKRNHKKRASKIFGIRSEHISVYYSSPWRKKIGYGIYTNNTALLRIVNNEIYKKLPDLIKRSLIDIPALMQGICDSEGTVDKANKLVSISNKDDFVINLISMCLTKFGIDFTKRHETEDKTKIDIRLPQKFNQTISFHTIRKQKELSEMLSGNYCREKDKIYLKVFYPSLVRGATAKQISETFHIPHPTVKLVLRNLFSGKYIYRKKISNHYVYAS